MPAGQNKSKSMLLTLIAVIVFFSGFIGVYLVNAAWERSVPETILVSDNSIVWYNQKMGDVSRDHYLKNFTSSVEFKTVYDGKFNTTELIPAYSGNNTFTFSLPSQLTPPAGDVDPVAGLNVMYFMIKIPNPDTFIMKDIWCHVNFSSNTLLGGKIIAAGGFDPAIALPDRIPAEYFEKRLYSDEPVGDTSIGEYTFDVDVPLADAIDFYQQAKNGKEDGWLYFEFYQTFNAGWTSKSVDLQFTINGTYIEEIDKSAAIAYSLGGAAFLCTMTMIFMTDSIDLKDILKKLKGV